MDEARHAKPVASIACVIIPRLLLDGIRARYLGLVPQVASRLSHAYFAGQVSLALAAYAQNASLHAIDIKYNFPNDELAESLYPDSLRDIRVIHYLRTYHFDRQQIFASREVFDRFLALDLRGSEKAFQEHVRALTRSRYPF